jgi:DNA primase
MSKRRNESLEKHRLSKIYDLVDVVKHYLELRKGYSVPYIGRCPFCPGHSHHSDKFAIYNSKGNQHYHCFLCRAHGDAIDFIQRIANVNFLGAIKTLESIPNVRKYTTDEGGNIVQDFISEQI